jgi:MFS family permease
LTRLKEDGLASSSTLSFAGGLTSAMISFLAIINSNIIKRFGSKAVLLVGVTILGLGEVLSGWTVNNIGGFFVTVGFVMGVGTSLIFMASLLQSDFSNIGKRVDPSYLRTQQPCTLLPSQYFSRKRGLAIGIVYSAGGVGGAVLSLVLDALLTKYGPAWTFRILGFITWGACLPACLLIKERPGKRSAAFIEW